MRRLLSLMSRVVPLYNRHDQVIVVPVAPLPSQATLATTPNPVAVTKTQIIGAVFNWSLCLLLMVLVLPQFLAVALSSSSSTKYSFYGRNPALGTYAIPGENDEPYSDRMMLCRCRGTRFIVNSVNEALAGAGAILEDSSGAAINGYRVVSRPVVTVNDATKRLYANACSMINTTLESILSVCNSLGYVNLTRNNFASWTT